MPEQNLKPEENKENNREIPQLVEQLPYKQWPSQASGFESYGENPGQGAH